MFQEGDIVEIPLPDGRIAIGWVLHVSKHFTNAVGFIVFGVKGRESEDVIYDLDTGKPLSTRILGPCYTHIEAMRHYGWKVFAHQPISDSKRQLTRRQVGENVYVGDECLGTAEELGESNLKQMQTMGMPIIYKEIERAFGSN